MAMSDKRRTNVRSRITMGFHKDKWASLEYTWDADHLPINHHCSSFCSSRLYSDLPFKVQRNEFSVIQSYQFVTHRKWFQYWARFNTFPLNPIFGDR